MKHDEFAFFNQQLAAMLREGIPLEGALRKLCLEMKRGRYRVAFAKIESDLHRGTPFEKAVDSSDLPDFYREMIRLGVASGDLPGVLTLAADYYRRTGAIWTRLRALLTYPLIVLLVSLALSVWFAFLYQGLNARLAQQLSAAPSIGAILGRTGKTPELFRAHWWLNLWMPPAILTAVVIGILAVVSAPAVRHRLRWVLAPFKEASLAQMAAALHLLIRQGLPLRESLAFLARLEPGDARHDLQLWMERHSQGHARFSEVAAGSVAVPSLFIWIVSSAGEDLADGFAQAAQLYSERAQRRAELLLNLVLPCALLALGLMIMAQIQPFMTSVFDIFTPLFKAGQIISP